MYEMIIIDDEFVIRDGICTLVDWEKIGFHSAAVLPTGEQGLAWLAQHPVDVVLTDVRMGAVSGLDIARYIHENKIPAKVVILSGHSDFDAAQQALEYKVDTFLLKPISLKRIRQTFTRVAEELDQREQLRASKALEMATKDSYLEDCFMEDLRYGILCDETRLAHALQRLGWQTLAQQPCALLTMEADQLESVLAEFDGDAEDMSEYIWAHMQKLGQLFPVSRQDSRFTGLWLDARAGMGACEDALARINALTGIRLSLTKVLRFESLPALLGAWETSWFTPDGITLAQLRERQQVVITHLSQDDVPSAKAHAMTFLSHIAERYDHAHSAAIDFIAGLVEHIRGGSRDAARDSVFPYAGLANARSKEELLEVASLLLDEIMRRMGEMKRVNKKQLVDRAIEYIAMSDTAAVSLEGAAEYAFVSPVYLSRIFKEVTGTNFKQYVIDQRIAHACEDLACTEDTVYAVCQAAGYRDIKHFYTLFARKMGCTPQEYRQRARATAQRAGEAKHE